MSRLPFLLLILVFYIPFTLFSQTFFGTYSGSLSRVEIGAPNCSCTVTPYVNMSSGISFGLTFDSDTILYGGVPDIYQIDTLTGIVTQVFDAPPGTQELMEGLVSAGGGVFYSMDRPSAGSTVYKIDISAGTVVELGSTGMPCHSDLTLYNGQIYYRSMDGVVLLDIDNPSTSELIAIAPDEGPLGLTVSPYCNTLVSVIDEPINNRIELINILDGTIVHLCDGLSFFAYITSIREHANPSPCMTLIDLDCDDSNGVTYYDCLSENGVAITDTDIALFPDDWLTEMSITIAAPIPDAPDEVLEMTGLIPNIEVTGDGTSTMILTNSGGASIQDFKDALMLIVYKNLSANPTGGLRIVEVQFTTESGMVSNIATYLIDVSDIPSIPVDLGPDTEICDGGTLILDAGNPGANYAWSTGDATQTITVDQSGQYIVTVTDGVNCPGMDTVLLEVLPNIDVALTGDPYICDNQSVILNLLTNTPFAIDIEIQADPGSSFIFNDVTDDFTFTDIPPEETTYMITSVTPSQPACITISDPVHTVEVFPSYIFEVDTSLCEGDSIWLGFFWETEAGTYENMLQTFDGCDSFVTTYITILPSVQIAQQSTTCDATQAGVFIAHLDNPNGCDTVVTTTISLLPADTTAIQLVSCRQADVGVSIDTFSNQAGCDSLIIMTTDYLPPTDTTFVFETTCDSSMISVINQVTVGIDGCDSIVVTTTTFMARDTIYLFETTCDSSMINEINHAAIDVNGCDSVTVITTAYMAGDTTYIFGTSCDSSDVGVINHGTTGVDGCDSTIITTITFSEQDSVFISETSCEPADVGTIVSQYVNQFGCDSIVTTTISLLPSDTTYLTDASCISADTGTWTVHLVNQYGCDSMVITTVSLLPSNQTFLNETTCQASQAGMFITTHLNQYGCDSIVTLTVELLEPDTTRLFYETCAPSETGVISFVESGSDGCDSIVIETTTLFPLPILDVLSAIDYNGFDISCTDEPDGSAFAIITGIEPFTYLWSTTETDQMITGLSAGGYAVTITDGNGCTATEVITLEQPDELMMSLAVTEPDCFDQALGAITVNASGGVSPYSYAIDGGLFQDGSVFGALGDGVYQLTVMDANECTTSEIIAIDIPLMVQVELGDNQVISLGDSTLLNAIINLPFDSLSSILWTGIDSIDCLNCLTQIVAPIITTAYSVTVTSADGCSDADSVSITVTTDQQLYIPNIFSPNGDGINDVLRISADEGVQEISAMEIYDRWGNLVFGFEHKVPNDPAAHWDGLFKGQALNPGVFTYKAVILYATGETEVRYGDVTLVR